jgi:hypothetical protein
MVKRIMISAEDAENCRAAMYSHQTDTLKFHSMIMVIHGTKEG